MLTLTDHELADLASFMKVNYGIELSSRKSFVEMRMQRVKETADFATFTEFFNHLLADISGASIADFVSLLTVNYTLFNRESLHFEYLTNEILPKLLEEHKYDKDIRIWSAGCATGEEPYTIAMTLMDYLGFNLPLWDCRVLATDISTIALKKAVKGIYPISSMDGLNPNWVRRYFVPDPNDPDTVSVSNNLKSQVILMMHNLVSSPIAFRRKFQCIFCRNVMIYFDDTTKYRLINKLYDALDDGGYLFIGMSETIDRTKTPFKYVMPSIYRKDGD